MAQRGTSAARPVRAGAAQPAAQPAAWTAETVAVLGAGGTMGLAMARNIARAGIGIRAWNRTSGKAGPLAADGAYIAETPADAAAGAGIVLTMLSDADAVAAVMEGDDGAPPVMAGNGDPVPALWPPMGTNG